MSDQASLHDRRNPGQYPCADHERRLSLTEQSVQSLKATNEGITTKLDLILAQITRVALLEEKHTNLYIDNDRAHKKIHDLDRSHDELARESREFMAYTRGQNKILWAIGAATAALFIKVVFFAANNGMTP